MASSEHRDAGTLPGGGTYLLYLAATLAEATGFSFLSDGVGVCGPLVRLRCGCPKGWDVRCRFRPNQLDRSGDGSLSPSRALAQLSPLPQGYPAHLLMGRFRYGPVRLVAVLRSPGLGPVLDAQRPDGLDRLPRTLRGAGVQHPELSRPLCGGDDGRAVGALERWKPAKVDRCRPRLRELLALAGSLDLGRVDSRVVLPGCAQGTFSSALARCPGGDRINRLASAVLRPDSGRDRRSPADHQYPAARHQ